MNNDTNRVLIIYGPTATGKTALAIKLAKKFNAELISADSRQVYKGLDIGTGKVSFESKIEKHQGYWVVDDVKIHGFDLVKPEENFSVADFIKFTQSSIIQIIKLKKLPIIVGGTGFYIKVLIEGIETVGVPANQDLREKLEKLSAGQLYQKLKKINPRKAKSMNDSDRLNPRRLIRAIEVSQSPVANHKLSINNQQLTINNLIIGLTAPNNYLYERADAWLMERLQRGMIKELKELISRGVDLKWLDNLGLEYRWISRHSKKEISIEMATHRLKGDIHSFIRHQKTWFNQFKNDLAAGRQVKIYDISSPGWGDKLEKDVDLWYNSHSLQAFP